LRKSGDNDILGHSSLLMFWRAGCEDGTARKMLTCYETRYQISTDG
jgi:hypothetical protein